MKALARSSLAIIIIAIIIIAGLAVYFASTQHGAATTTTTTTTTTTPQAPSPTTTTTQQPTATQTTTKSSATTSTTTTTTTTTTQATTVKKVNVAVVFDVGGRGDLSFNDMAYLGAMRAEKELGAHIEFITPRSTADMQPLLAQLSKSGKYDLIVLIGFLWTAPLNKTADQFPNQKYALIDSTTGVVRKNEVDILFREQECAALVGILASAMALKLGGNTVAALAGMDIPPLWKFHIGYLFGVKYFEKETGKKINFLWQYTGTFTDTQKGYTVGMQLIQQGARVIYGLAGLTHLGMFNAVKDWDKQHPNDIVLAIGQDASQEWIDPYHIPISGAKRVDVAVFTAIKMVATGNWKPGIITLGLKEGGVGIWDLQGVRYFAELAYKEHKTTLTPDEIVKIVNETRHKYIPAYAWQLVNKLEQMIISGQIAFKTPMTHDEYQKIIQELQNGNLDAALSKGHV